MSGVPTAAAKAREKLTPRAVNRALKMRLGGESREVKLVWAFLANAGHLGDSLLVKADGTARTPDEVIAAAARHDLVVGIMNAMNLTDADLRRMVEAVAEWRE